MTHDEMIEAVAKAIYEQDSWRTWKGKPAFQAMARAAIRVIAPAVLEEAAVWVQENYPFDKRTLVPAIRAMKTRYEQ